MNKVKFMYKKSRFEGYLKAKELVKSCNIVAIKLCFFCCVVCVFSSVFCCVICGSLLLASLKPHLICSPIAEALLILRIRTSPHRLLVII